VTPRVAFLSLKPAEDAREIRSAVDRVIDRGWFVLGPEVEAFEHEFAAASGAPYAVGVGSGTDAIALTLRALDVGPGDEVITTPLSAAFTALAIAMVGARPVFADIDPVRLTIDPAQIERMIGPRTRAIVPVHLYGQPADMNGIERVTSRYGLAVVEDCCQAHLATVQGRPVGTIGAAGAFSFYPTKNLGALGDGGAVITRDAALADRVRQLRNGGQRMRYDHNRLGVNSRLDEIQAAVLRTRLPRLQAWTARRRELAARYRAALRALPVEVPPECDAGHVYHLFVVRVPDRNRFQEQLAADGIETLVHYPLPIPRQQAFTPMTPADCPIAERACDEVLSLPLHPGLSDDDLDSVVLTVKGRGCAR
jgi:dTDP-3-amino-3,4,6-trideoxy-alpha-D-glucose transaminase